MTATGTNTRTVRQSGLLEGSGARVATSGFFITGTLISFLGAILPSWGFHFSGNYYGVGNTFLAFSLGLLGSARLAEFLLPRKGLRWTLAASCGLASASLLWLAWFATPASQWWRLAGLLMLGAATGLLQSATLQAVIPLYRYNRAATVNIASMLFGMGCVATALFVSLAYHVYTLPSLMILLAVLPALFAGVLSQHPHEAQGVATPAIWHIWRNLRDPIAVQLGLVLVVQFANEWSIAGWLPLFLTQRLGISPSSSLRYLAAYWLMVTLGRVAAQAVLSRNVSQGRLLFAAAGGALLGTLILTSTDNLFGVGCGLLFLSASFGLVHPLVLDRISNRLPSLDPVYFHGIFSVAFPVALMVPAFLGYLAGWTGIANVMYFPVVGSAVVFLLLLIVGIETKFERRGNAPANQSANEN